MESSLRVSLASAAIAGALLSASPAAALPVFNAASATPDAISPNGDDVQDLTVILYDVAVDSADVRVLLGVTGGGAIVDTLQVFTRRGRGLHSLPFDGSSPSGPVPDGSYEIRILGVGTQGEGTEPRVLPLVIDRIPPGIVSWELSPPGPRGWKNGDTLTLQACFDALPDSVGVDLTPLDSGFDPGLVVVTSPSADCLRFTTTITPGNTRADAADDVALVIALDRARNRSTASFPLCLDNVDPSVSEPPSLVNQSPFFQNGDEIQAEIGFTGAATAGGDFSPIDSAFDPDSVEVDPLGGGRFRVRYRLSQANTRPDGAYRIPLFGFDGDCGSAADSTLAVNLDNAGSNSALVDNVFVDPPAFSPSGTGVKQVGVHFTVLTDTLIISVSANAVLRSPADTANVIIQRSTVYTAGSHTVIWNGGSGPTFPPSRLVDQDLDVILRVTSVALDRQRTIVTGLEVDSTPPALTAFPPPSELVFHNGQVAEVPLTYDRAGYQIVADFSAIDANFNPASVAVTDRGGGEYSIFYSVSGINPRSDATDLPILLTATDGAGNLIGPVNLVRGCLDNLPPRFVSASFPVDSGPFKNGDHVVIRTEWQTETTQGPPRLEADFSAVDDHFDPVQRPASVVDRGNGVFDIGYTLNALNGIKQGVDLPIRVTASDPPGQGCGSTTVDAIGLDLDSEAGAKPTFDILPQVARSSRFTLSGSAPDAALVQITVADVPVDTFAVDPSTFRFSGEAVLKPGANVFRARGLDLAGNLSPPSDPLEVFLLESTTLQVPGRFAPGDQFFLALVEPAQGVTVRIYNLEGIEVQRIEAGAGDLYRIPWDGIDSSGELSASGPCIAVLEIAGSGGGVRERVRKAFVFTRKKASP